MIKPISLLVAASALCGCSGGELGVATQREAFCSTRTEVNGLAVPVVDLDALDSARPLGRCADVLIDTTDVLDIDQISGPVFGRQFEPAAASVLNKGYVDSAIWLRFALRNAGARDPHWLLEMAFPQMDWIELYEQLPNGGVVLRRAGDQYPYGAREVDYHTFLFKVAIAAGDTHIYYLRMVSTSEMIAPLYVWRAPAFTDQALIRHAALWFYFGLVLALAIYNLFLFVSVRDRAYLYYVVYIGAFAMAQFCLNGLGYEILWPNSPWFHNHSICLFGYLALLGALLFSASFLATRANMPQLHRVGVCLGIVIVGSELLLPVLPLAVSIVILNSLTQACVAMVLSAGVLAFRRGYRPARYFLLAWLTLLGGIALFTLRNLGFVDDGFVSQYAMQMGTAVEAVLLSFALAYRIAVLREEKDLYHRALEAKHRALTDLNEQLEAKVRQRTEELCGKNAELERIAATDALTELYSRAELLRRFDVELRRVERYGARTGSHLCVLFIDLDHFKPYNDTFGHRAGDFLLASFARLLASCSRATDVLCRYGGDEFVVLLTETDIAAAILYAEKLYARFDAQEAFIPDLSRCLGFPALIASGERLSFSVGIVECLPGATVDALLNRADAALYRAKGLGRAKYAVG